MLGFGLAVLWTLHRVLTRRGTGVLSRLAVAATAAAVSLAILAPSLGLFLISARSTGAMEATPHRVGLGTTALRLLVDPFALGDPRTETFSPPAPLRGVGYADLALTVGWITAGLALLGLASRRKGTGFWALTGAAALVTLSWTPAAHVLGTIPGLAHVPPWKISPVVALAAAVLAAHGTEALRTLRLPRWTGSLLPLLGLAIVLQQGLLAGHLLTWLRPGEAVPPPTPGLRVLEEMTRGTTARVAPLGDVLWPDTAQWFGLEDVRSRFASTRDYRKLVAAIDPQAWDHGDRLLRLNPATVELAHPYLRALGARWVLEDPRYQLVELSLAQETLEIEPRDSLLGPLRRTTRREVVQELVLPPHCSRLALNATSLGHPVKGSLRVRLEVPGKGSPLASWTIDAGVLSREGNAWMDLPPGQDSPPGRLLVVEPHITEGRIWLRTTSDPSALEGSLRWGSRRIGADLGLSLDLSGYVRAWEGRDLRIWENRRALERFWAVGTVVTGDLQTLIDADPPLDLERVAVVPPGGKGLGALLQGGGAPAGTARVSIRRRSLDAWSVAVQSSHPVLLVSSLPAIPSLWRVEVDGSPVEWIPANALFLGVPVPEGRHEVEVRAGLPTAWLALCGLGLVAFAGFLGLAVRRDGGGAP